MSLEIYNGLFVGVDRYAQRRDNRLQHASSDATSLHQYFRAARPNGHWSKLVSTTNKAPRQVEILAELTKFAKNLPVGESGIFYFSGHASMCDRGLVLKSYDAHDDFPIDTGLRLARVLEIVKAQAAQKKRFLVILDCCRDSDMPAVADDIPPNCCILYASGLGQAALESSQGGVLTRSFIESMNAIGRETDLTVCPLRALCNRLTRQLFGWRPASALTVELHGNGADQLHLPIARTTVAVQGTEGSGPTAVLNYYFGSEKEYNEAFGVLGRRILHWYGIRHTSPGGRMYVQEHFERPANSSGRPDQIRYFFQVRMPDRCSHWTPSDFLVHLLEGSLEVSETIKFNWPYRIEDSVFKELRHAVDGEWVSGAYDEHGLRWPKTPASESAKYRGAAWILRDTPNETSVTIRCETMVDSYEMPLRLLLPSLRDVYDLMQSIR